MVETLKAMDLEQVCLVGEEFRKALEQSSLDAKCFADSDALAAWLQDHPITGCMVLVKGSRGTRMEKTIASL